MEEQCVYPITLVRGKQKTLCCVFDLVSCNALQQITGGQSLPHEVLLGVGAVVNLTFINETYLGGKIYVKLLCACSSTQNYKQVSLVTYFSHQSSCCCHKPRIPASFPFAVYCLFSHSSLLYNCSRTLIYHWLTLSCLHYLPFLSWCTGTLQIQLNLLRYCSFWLMHPSFKVERFLILPLISVLPHLSAVSGLMQKCCIN